MAELEASDVVAALREPGEAARRALRFGVDFASTARLLSLRPSDRVATLFQAAPHAFGEVTIAMIDPLAIARHLGSYAVRYVLVGGSAMRARGMQYATEDYDICYDPTPANAERLIAALLVLDPVLRVESRGVTMPVHLDLHTLRGTQILTLATRLGNVDLLSMVDGVGGYEELLARSTVLTIGEDAVPVMRYEALVDAKRAAGRGKDLFVLPELEALAEIEHGKERSQEG